MKATFERNEVKGFVVLDLNHIRVNIEWKYFINAGQLNLRMEKLKFKDKDKFIRKKHEYDYLKPLIQKYLKKQIKSIPVMQFIREEHPITNTVWWE